MYHIYRKVRVSPVIEDRVTCELDARPLLSMGKRPCSQMRCYNTVQAIPLFAYYYIHVPTDGGYIDWELINWLFKDLMKNHLYIVN